MEAPFRSGSAEASLDLLWRYVLRLSWPAVLGSLMQTLVFLADRIMLGRFDAVALGSMQIQGPVLWSLFSVFFAALVGTVTLVSQFVGAGNAVAARRVARTSLEAATLLGVLVGVAVSGGAGWIAAFFGPADTQVTVASRAYLEVAGFGMPGLFLSGTAAMVLQASGDTRTPFVAGAAANLLNIAVNALLIYGWETPFGAVPAYGVVGASAGTSGAFVLEGAILCSVLLRRGHPLCVRGVWTDGGGGRGEVLRGLARLAGPAVLDRIAVHTGFLAFVRVIASLGPLAMAANQALVTLESVCFLTADGFAVAAATVTGQRLGAGDAAGARRGARIAVGLACATLSSIGLGIWALGPTLLHVFVPPGSSPAALVQEAAPCFPILALAQPVMAAAVVLAHALRGAGDTRSPFLAAAAGSLLARVGVAHLATGTLGLGLVGIWWASTADWAVRTAVVAAVFLWGGWARSRVTATGAR